MAQITLITGGSRSGKSTYAEELCDNLARKTDKDLVYIATCPRIENDADMDDRIDRHKARRAGKGWFTVEEECDLLEAIADNADACILVECLTLWVNNLMWKAEQNQYQLTEDLIHEECLKLINTCLEHDVDITFVTNETGMGVMPDNATARLFSDLAGRCNQTFAKAADDVYFMVSGLAMKVK